MLSIKEIVELNELAEGPGLLNRPEMLDSALSSYLYYNKTQDKIASIVKGIIKNHPFIDGNKRTALLVCVALAKNNNIKLKEISKDTIVDIANNNYSVEKISNILFF